MAGGNHAGNEREGAVPTNTCRKSKEGPGSRLYRINPLAGPRPMNVFHAIIGMTIVLGERQGTSKNFFLIIDRCRR
jgi:hypothetical protein